MHKLTPKIYQRGLIAALVIGVAGFIAMTIGLLQLYSTANDCLGADACHSLRGQSNAVHIGVGLVIFGFILTSLLTFYYLFSKSNK